MNKKTSYSRKDIADGLFQAIGAELPRGEFHQPLSDEERTLSLRNFIATRPSSAQHIWVFAYGSLIWNPGLHYLERQSAYIHGYHRCFCLKVYVGRGNMNHPGLLLGLDRGGSCRGIAYRIDENLLQDELSVLWKREMMGGGYRPHWVKGKILDDKGNLIKTPMISFVIRHDTPRYYGDRNLDHIQYCVENAHGTLGSCKDYVVNTQEALLSAGIKDPLLETMMERLQKSSHAQDSTQQE